jgi:hypothetical protein
LVKSVKVTAMLNTPMSVLLKRQWGPDSCKARKESIVYIHLLYQGCQLHFWGKLKFSLPFNVLYRFWRVIELGRVLVLK